MNGTPTEVLRTRAALALAFLLARYVPIPFLDDVIRERIGRAVVARAAAPSGHALAPDEIARLAAPSDGCVGCLVALLWAPLKFFFFPIAVLLGISRGSRDLVEVFALGRTIERLLADGRYPFSSPPETRLGYALDVRIAFDRARRGLDTHAVKGLLSVALGPLRKVAPAAMRSMRRFWHGDAGAPDAPIEAPTDRLVAALDDPRMKALFESIDRRFDEALLAQRAKS
jgi:hypothetical protein